MTSEEMEALVLPVMEVAKMSGSVKLTHEASCDIADARQGRFEFSEGGKEQK